MEEFDLNSQDSGYGTSFNDRETKIFNFAHPTNTVTRKTSDQFFDSPKSKGSSSSIFNSFSSGSIESMDDGFLELVDLDTVDDNAQLPCNFNSLISGSLKNQTPVSNNTRIRPSFRRSVSMKEGSSTSKARSCLFKPSTPELFENRPFKRPEPPVDAVSPVQPKRYKFNELGGISPLKAPTASGHPRVQRSFSANEATIMSAVQRCKYPTHNSTSSVELLNIFAYIWLFMSGCFIDYSIHRSRSNRRLQQTVLPTSDHWSAPGFEIHHCHDTG